MFKTETIEVYFSVRDLLKMAGIPFDHACALNRRIEFEVVQKTLEEKSVNDSKNCCYMSRTVLRMKATRPVK